MTQKWLLLLLQHSCFFNKGAKARTILNIKILLFQDIIPHPFSPEPFHCQRGAEYILPPEKRLDNPELANETTQMKALDEYILMVLFV